MKSIIKIVTAVVVLAGIVAMSSCHRQTCPTYTKTDNAAITEIRA